MYISFFECFSTMCITSRNRKFTYELYCSQFGRLFTIIVLEKRIRVNVISRFDFGIFRELLTFSVPLIPNYLSWWIVDSSDSIYCFVGSWGQCKWCFGDCA